ncbi:hypothetical protein ES703_63061 [subsurface metagenome]
MVDRAKKWCQRIRFEKDTRAWQLPYSMGMVGQIEPTTFDRITKHTRGRKPKNHSMY